MSKKTQFWKTLEARIGGTLLSDSPLKSERLEEILHSARAEAERRGISTTETNYKQLFLGSGMVVAGTTTCTASAVKIFGLSHDPHLYMPGVTPPQFFLLGIALVGMGIIKSRGSETHVDRISTLRSSARNELLKNERQPVIDI